LHALLARLICDPFERTTWVLCA